MGQYEHLKLYIINNKDQYSLKYLSDYAIKQGYDPQIVSKVFDEFATPKEKIIQKSKTNKILVIVFIVLIIVGGAFVLSSGFIDSPHTPDDDTTPTIPHVEKCPLGYVGVYHGLKCTG